MSGFFWSLLFCRCVHHSADVLPRSPLSFNMEGAGRGAGVRAGCMRRLTKIAIGAQHEVVSLADGQPHCPFPLLARQQYGQTWPLAHLTGVQVCRRGGMHSPCSTDQVHTFQLGCALNLATTPHCYSPSSKRWLHGSHTSQISRSTFVRIWLSTTQQSY
jgi:hypothetical protein